MVVEEPVPVVVVVVETGVVIVEVKVAEVPELVVTGEVLVELLVPRLVEVAVPAGEVASKVCVLIGVLRLVMV